MTLYYEEDGTRIFNGDCREVLPLLADCSVDSVVTDPPYELGFMGKSWDRSGIAYQVEVWRECLRVLKPGGHLLAFGGSRTYHRLACAIEDAGFEIRDQIQWIYGSGFPKSLDVSKAIDAAFGVEREQGRIRTDGRGKWELKMQREQGDTGVGHADGSKQIYVETLATSDAARQWNGWGTALKPAHEPIVMARKPLDGTVAENVLKHGTGGINVDGCRIETDGRPLREVHALRDGVDYAGNSLAGRLDGSLQSSKAIGSTILGRWPANVIHDGSDEVVRLFPVSDANGYRANPSTVNLSDAVVGYSGNAVRGERGHDDIGSAARFFYCAKASKEDRDEGLAASHNHHPTVKPTELMRYLVRLVTPPNGIVLDPFGGSGSTAKACALEDFKALLIEKELEYCEIAMRRAQLRQRRLMYA